jgi:hypothetical protein
LVNRGSSKIACAPDNKRDGAAANPQHRRRLPSAKGVAMSLISLGGASGIAQLLQGLTSNSSAYPGAAGSTSSSGAASQFLSLTSEAMHHHHHTGGLFQQIQQAVTSTLQSGGATSNASANQAIQNAIAQVLKSNAASTANPNFAAANPSNNQNAQTFLQMLQAHGITPQQFQTDLQAAMQEEGVDASNVANQIPPGLLVNAIG